MIEFFPKGIELKEVVAFVIASAAGVFALWRWTIEQRWRRVQYAYGLIKEFMAKENTIKALQMLDSAREIDLFPDENLDKDRYVFVDDEIVIASLKTFDEQTSFPRREFAVRNIFDEFFTDLSAFQHHIDAKLLKLEDIRPYLEYWIKSINGYGKVYDADLARQINKFLVAFEYDAVIQLSYSMGYPLVAQDANERNVEARRGLAPTQPR
jgi:hypothetical protein